MEKAEKDDLNELADTLGAALVLQPGKPTDMETNEQASGEENTDDEEEEMESDDDGEV